MLLLLQDYADCSLQVVCGTYIDLELTNSGLRAELTVNNFTQSTENISSLTTNTSSKLEIQKLQKLLSICTIGLVSQFQRRQFFKIS